MLMQNGTMGNGTDQPSAATAITGSNSVAFAGVLAAFFYTVL